jgi:eukaryotic-like serine/threonine-protein kinase
VNIAPPPRGSLPADADRANIDPRVEGPGLSQQMEGNEGGRLLGRFTIGRCLGSGTFGVVYEAREEGRAGKVALKRLNELDSSAIYAFKQEFRALSDVVHPNLVSLYELFQAGDQLYISMELIEGVGLLGYVRSDLRVLDLASVPTVEIRGGSSADMESGRTVSEPTFDEPPPPPPTTRIVDDRARPQPILGPGDDFDFEGFRATLRQLVSGVFAIHSAGKLHRDLKPSNVMVNQERRVKILDFGLVASLSGWGAKKPVDRRVVGTPAYMSPEQAQGALLTPASDWYSFGVILYEALTGRLPITGTVQEILAKKHLLDPPDPRLLVPGLPDDLSELCMALLQREPGVRPNGPAVLRALGAPVPEASPHSVPWSEVLPFVGREHHLNVLEEAFTVAKSGRAVTIHIHGTSGMGKSALLRRFLDGLVERDAAVVLEGKCYERESVPYKAVDSLIDALAQHLRALPKPQAIELVPRDARELARLFPVLRRIEALADAPRKPQAPDPKELRRRAFRALREIFGKMASIRPLVICIDDLQWGDADSAALIMDLIEPSERDGGHSQSGERFSSPSGPPPLLLILSYRSEDVATIDLVRVVRQRLARGELAFDMRELVVGPLAHREARALARVLLAGDPALLRGEAEVIAVESGGSPFFVHELARYVHAGGCAPRPPEGGAPGGGVLQPISLQQVLAARLARLSQSALRLLSAIAIAGSPISYAAVSQAYAESGGHGPPDPQIFAVLRAEHLVRSRGTRAQIEVETFHDRIREAVVASLTPEAIATWHRHLAAALEASGDADPEALFTHFVAGGDAARALAFVEVAADRAESALAFDRAAALYKKAIELRGDAPQPLRARRAHALANAGRGAEAARAYLDACRGASPAEELDLRRRAAEQFLRSGHIDEGIDAIQDVLRVVDLSMPKTPARALTSLVLRRAQLSVRGLGFTERSLTDVRPADLTRIDVCWSVGNGLGGVDPVRGADFQARHLLYALRAGEPYRIARALSLEASLSALESDQERAATLVARSAELSERIGDPHALAWVAGARAGTAYYGYRFREALMLSERAVNLFRESSRDITWEIGSIQSWWLLPSLYLIGEIDELCRRVPICLREAEELGALYYETTLRSWHMFRVHVAMDRPAEARRDSADALGRWSHQHGFHTQHLCDLQARVHSYLYEGDGVQALAEIERDWPALDRSLLLRFESSRIEALFPRAAAALVASRQSDDPEGLLRAAERHARTLEKEKVPYASAYALLLRAGIALRRGRPEQAIALYGAAEQAFSGLDMTLHAVSARRRRGEIVGGEEGFDLVQQATEWMIGQRIRNPERMTAMLAPL